MIKIFGWFISRKSPVEEPETMRELFHLLKKQEAESKKQLAESEKKAKLLKKQLDLAIKERDQRKLQAKREATKGAIKHLKIAERYEEQMHQAEIKGHHARVAALNAIVVEHCEQAKGLGVELIKNNISKTINAYT